MSVWIHIRRGGREFKSPSRYLKVFRMKGLYLFRAWIHIRRGGREPALPQAGSNLPLATEGFSKEKPFFI